MRARVPQHCQAWVPQHCQRQLGSAQISSGWDPLERMLGFTPEGRRATSPNLSQTITAVAVTIRGYSCRPGLHRKKKVRQSDIERGDKTLEEIHFTGKKVKEGIEVSYWATALKAFPRTPHSPEQSLGQEEREAAEKTLPLHTAPWDFPQTAATWQT